MSRNTAHYNSNSTVHNRQIIFLPIIINIIDLWVIAKTMFQLKGRLEEAYSRHPYPWQLSRQLCWQLRYTTPFAGEDWLSESEVQFLKIITFLIMSIQLMRIRARPLANFEIHDSLLPICRIKPKKILVCIIKVRNKAPFDMKRMTSGNRPKAPDDNQKSFNTFES